MPGDIQNRPQQTLPDGLPLHRYLSLLDMLNPMHRLWSDGRWNKLTVAHGCYWKKCSFCDVTLDYIARYDEAQADLILDRMEALIAETGQTGFHFVDEAAPPKVLLALAQKPDYAEAAFNLGACHEALNQLDEAEAALRWALEIHPHYLAAMVNLGALLERRHSLEQLWRHDRAYARRDLRRVHARPHRASAERATVRARSLGMLRSKKMVAT